MIEFSKWIENHNVNTVRGQVVSDRGELGVAGFEGLQDILDALKVVARLPGGRAAISGMAGRLTTMLPDGHEDLKGRLRTGASKFVGASSKLDPTDTSDSNFQTNKQGEI